TTASITPFALTVAATGHDRQYDATTAADVTLAVNRFAGDVVAASYTAASFTDKNVGNAKDVTITGIALTGVDASNYTVNTTAHTTASITPFALTTSATGHDRQYDATTAAD